MSITLPALLTPPNLDRLESISGSSMSRIPLLLVLLVAAVGAYDPYEHVCDDIDNPDRAQTAENACATLCYMEVSGTEQFCLLFRRYSSLYSVLWQERVPEDWRLEAVPLLRVR